MSEEAALRWIDDLLDRYRVALSQLGRSPAQIDLATIAQKQAIARLRSQEKADEVVG